MYYRQIKVQACISAQAGSFIMGVRSHELRMTVSKINHTHKTKTKKQKKS